MKKKRLIGIAIAAALVSTGIGVGYTYYITNTVTERVLQSQEEKQAAKNEALKFMTEEHTSEEIKEKLLETFEKVGKDKEICTELVDTYLYGVYNTCAQYTMNETDTNALYACMNPDGTFDFDALPEGDLKTLVHELADDHIIPRFLNGALFWDVDYAYFDTTFRDYVKEDYRDMIHFYATEKEESYQDDDGEAFYPEIVENRLDTLYRMMEVYSDSEIRSIMEESYYFYKAVYLGAYAQGYIFESGSIRPKVLEAYRNYAAVCKDQELAEFLKELIAAYEEANGTRTVPIFEDIKEFCGFYYPEEELK